MSHFSDNKTQVELFIVENFNYEDDNPYTSQIEEEGEFVKIEPTIKEEDKDDDTVSTKRKLPSE